MKTSGNNFFKYIFIVVVIGLIGGAIYMIYYNNTEKTEEDENTNSISSENISIVDNLKMGITNFDTINPILTKNREIVNIDKLIFDPLFNITSDYNLEQALGLSISKVTDTSYEVKLNTSIKWQDGSSFTAGDVIFTLEQIKNTESIYYQNIKDISSVETVSDDTIIFNLNYDVPFFEFYLTFPILSSKYYEGEDFVNSSKIPIGTGMYKIASIDNDNILIIRNDREI